MRDAEQQTRRRPVRSPRNANRLLASMRPTELAQLEPYLEAFRLRQRAVLLEPGDIMRYVYFPSSGILSSLIVLDDGGVVEIATIGNEGMADITAMFGQDEAVHRLLVQVPGQALRMPTMTFQRLLRESPTLQAIIGRYLRALFTLVGQSAACNRLHTIQERCARWLLMTHDRVGTDTFPITQEFLADILGSRRASVTVAEGTLREAGFIQYRRGRVTILNRQGLEQATCECYAVIRETFDRLFAENPDEPSTEPR
jgi:CRP-like cAMP-binding protein